MDHRRDTKSAENSVSSEPLWFILLFFEGVAGATESKKCVRVMRTSSPVALGADELLLGDEKPALTALMLLVINFVAAGISECGKLLLHWISSHLNRDIFLWRLDAVNHLIWQAPAGDSRRGGPGGSAQDSAHE